MQFENWQIKEETYLKAQILSRGVIFTEAALQYAAENNAKTQNRVYNMPLSADKARPQELFITHKDGFRTVVSCVAPSGPSPVLIDAADGLTAKIDNMLIDHVFTSFVPEPEYYPKKISNGDPVKNYVTACGYDELNIIPWKGCALSTMCKFCGSNNYIDGASINAHSISADLSVWRTYENEYTNNLIEAVKIAKSDACYENHMHVILISGNLCNNCLDEQSLFYSNIVKAIYPYVKDKATEGIIVVITPPKNLNLLMTLKDAGVEKVVFNLELGDREYFKKYCPGKNSLGYDFFIERLLKAVEVFGWGNAWCNFVFGLEPDELLLPVCCRLAANGIITSANVLHLDIGNSLDCGTPSAGRIIRFFYELNQINVSQNLKPFYCTEALRTSLSNEAFHNRIMKP
jgi:hypothetical protein